MKKMGCGRDWFRPAGCHNTACIKWCYSDLCNKGLIKQSPFRKELSDEEANDEDVSTSDWWSSLFGSSAAVSLVSPGIFFLLLTYNITDFL